MLKNYILSKQTLYILQEKKTNLGILFVMKSLVVALNKTKKCSLCLFCEKMFKKHLTDNMEAREFLLRNKKNEQKLREFVDLIWTFFQKMAFLNKRSLQFFNDEYRWLMRNYQEGTTSSLTMEEIIECNIELVELNGIEKYCNFTFS